MRVFLVRFVVIALLFLLLADTAARAQSPTTSWDTYSDTWAATDDLGRQLPDQTITGPPRANRTVGMFYFLTFDQKSSAPFDNTKILSLDPRALSNVSDPIWGPLNASHYWGKPLFGYYISADDWVLRKHAQMLKDAGVDIIIIDNSNSVTYDAARDELLRVWEEIRREGGSTPQIAFLCPFSNYADGGTNTLFKLYNLVYANHKYDNLLFHWQGKPLILSSPDYASDAAVRSAFGVLDPNVPAQAALLAEASQIRSYFTFRTPIAPYNETTSRTNSWAWLQIFPQTAENDSAGTAEEISMGVAQNYNSAVNRTAPMSFPGAYGRSYHDGKEATSTRSVDQGYNFHEQIEHALEVDPPFIFVTGWNEWTAGFYSSWAGFNSPPVVFVDEFDEEYSRDIEPMDGGHGDDYYYQLVSAIRRYKGVRQLQPVSLRTITSPNDFSLWRDIEPEYRDDYGDSVHRQSPGVGSSGPYANSTGRNDIVAAKVAYDAKNIYFYVRTAAPLTRPAGNNWMLLYIKVVGRSGSGWLGYNYLVNRRITNTSTSLEENVAGQYVWADVASLKYAIARNQLEITVPRNKIGLAVLPNSIEFKWADNCYQKGDWTDFLLNGDAAPDGRFNYVARFKR